MSDVMLDVREPREMTRALRALENAVEELRDQLDRERQRADVAEQQLARLEAELARAQAEGAGLRCQLEQARNPPEPEPPKSRLRGRLHALGYIR
jgi:chromosome segregation ATPase